jgi:hypothetical protein
MSVLARYLDFVRRGHAADMVTALLAEEQENPWDLTARAPLLTDQRAQTAHDVLTEMVCHRRVRAVTHQSAECSCGWLGPARPDELWRNADWFGHDTEVEAAELQRSGGEW